MSSTESFEKRFVDLVDDGQFSANCPAARALVREARDESAFTKESIPDAFFVEVSSLGKCTLLTESSFGILFWKEKEDRENGVFIEFNQMQEPISYVDYKELHDAKFLRADVCLDYYRRDED